METYYKVEIIYNVKNFEGNRTDNLNMREITFLTRRLSIVLSWMTALIYSLG